MGWGWGLWSIQVELPGPAMQGCGGWIQSCRFSAQLLTALPHLRTSARSVNISTYVLAVNRFCKSCQHPLVLVFLSGSESLLCLLVPKALGMDVGRASYRRRTRKQRKTAAGNLQGDSPWGGSWLYSVQGVSLQGIFGGRKSYSAIQWKQSWFKEKGSNGTWRGKKWSLRLGKVYH